MKLDMKIQIKKDFQHFNEMVLILSITFSTGQSAVILALFMF